MPSPVCFTQSLMTVFCSPLALTLALDLALGLALVLVVDVLLPAHLAAV